MILNTILILAGIFILSGFTLRYIERYIERKIEGKEFKDNFDNFK